ncbi:hypothetical protein Droror1_Dr00012126 [Drosera rotundifolia]
MEGVMVCLGKMVVGTMDEGGNKNLVTAKRGGEGWQERLSICDTVNLAIRKIEEAGVTTIAGGKSSVPGYSDGPGEDTKFSFYFDVVYIHCTCSLLVVDRGNAAVGLRVEHPHGNRL